MRQKETERVIKDRQGAEREHVKLLGAKCDSP